MGVIDLTVLDTTKVRLQDATDSAALAVSAADTKNSSTPEATLKTLAASVVQANFQGAIPTVTQFSVCTATQTVDCAISGGKQAITNTVTMTTNVRAPCWVPAYIPGICSNGGQSMLLSVSNVTKIGFANIQINMLLDVSGSMIVGATTSDVSKIETWVANHWSQVHYAGDSNQVVPCAFACHDEGPSPGYTSQADMQAGLTNAQAAGATTRYDVMTAAASDLINHVQTEVQTNTQLANNSYAFNIYSISDQLALQPTPTNTSAPNPQALAFTNAKAEIAALKVGINTHMNENLPTFATDVGVGGNTANGNPQKFVIMVTDGLESDFYKDFYSCTGYFNDPNWPTPTTPPQPQQTATGCFAAPMSTAACTTMKNNGVTLAVLETPYVPLTGQDPNEQLYEGFVRHTIYPGGPSSASTVSAALQACASPGYYYQANSSSDISTGFVSLTDKFLATIGYIKQ